MRKRHQRLRPPFFSADFRRCCSAPPDLYVSCCEVWTELHGRPAKLCGVPPQLVTSVFAAGIIP